MPSAPGTSQLRHSGAGRVHWKGGLSWPESPLISGRLPRGAGFIALHEGQCGLEGKRLHVCLVTKRSGVESFPKGPRREKAAEPVFGAAVRHWKNEAGLNMNRIRLLRNFHVDDPSYRCRYLIADCGSPTSTSV